MVARVGALTACMPRKMLGSAATTAAAAFQPQTLLLKRERGISGQCRVFEDCIDLCFCVWRVWYR
jgi:hypothetical protein